jgi:lipoprotein-releasing system permease protein
LLTNIEKLITIRNLKSKKKEGFLKIISAFSFLGIMLGVAILIIVMSVMNGFRSELTQRILGFNSHITVKPYSDQIDNKFYLDIKKKIEGKGSVVKAYNGEAVVLVNETAKGILIRGLENETTSQLKFFSNNIIDGKLSNFDNGKIIIGKQLAIELGVVVGDKINIMSSSLVTTPAGFIPKQSLYEISAVFSSGLYEFDRNVVFFNLLDSLSFFEKNIEEFNLEIFLKNPLNADIYKNEIFFFSIKG